MNITFAQKDFEITQGLLYAVEQIAKAFTKGVQNQETGKWQLASYIGFSNFEEKDCVFGSIRLPIIGDSYDFLIENVSIDDLKFLPTLFSENKMSSGKNGGFSLDINANNSCGFIGTLGEFIRTILENYNHYEDEYPDFDLFSDDYNEADEIIAEVNAKVKAEKEAYYAELTELADCNNIVERLLECL